MSSVNKRNRLRERYKQAHFTQCDQGLIELVAITSRETTFYFTVHGSVCRRRLGLTVSESKDRRPARRTYRSD